MDKINAQVFLKVAETGSFRKTADALGYTQAGISYIINNMESEIGLNLFIRERSGVRLSAEGQALLPEIEQLAIWERKFTQSVNELADLKRGKIRVQIFDSISVHWIPGILRKFHDDYPGIEVELITEEDTAKAEEMVRSGDVDCGFFHTRVGEDLDCYKLIEENLKAVVAEDSEMADWEYFPISELEKHPYIALKYEIHSNVGGVFSKYKIKPNTIFQMDNDYAALAMVRQGLGYCIFAELLLLDMPKGLKALNFSVPQKRIISVGTTDIRTCSKACRKFIEYTRAWVAEQRQGK